MTNDISSTEIADSFRDPTWGAKQLRSITIFKGFSDTDLKSIYKLGEIRTLRPHSYAVIEGEPTRGLYITLLGTLSVYKNDTASGTMTRLAYLEQGSHFGELSLFDDAPRSATVAAESVCHLFHLDAVDFETFLKNSNDKIKVDFYRNCAEELCVRFRKLNSDYIAAQQMLWKHALRKTEDLGGA